MSESTTTNRPRPANRPNHIKAVATYLAAHGPDARQTRALEREHCAHMKTADAIENCDVRRADHGDQDKFDHEFVSGKPGWRRRLNNRQANAQRQAANAKLSKKPQKALASV